MKKSLSFLVILLVYHSPVSGQWYIGGDIGHLSFDVEDQIISTTRFEGGGRSLVNPSVIFLSKKSYLSIRYGFKKTRLNPERDMSDFLESNYLDFENYELDIEYLRNVFSKSDLSAYLGLSYYGHFSYFNRLLKTRFLDSSQSSHEMAALNLSVTGMIRYNIGTGILLYKTGIGFIGYGSRPVSNFRGGYLNFQSLTPGNYLDWINSFSAFLPISDTVTLKPEYRFRFYNYEEPRTYKMLKQSFLIGLYITL